MYGEQKKFKAKMTYADKQKIPYVVFLGEDEISRGVVKVKEMTSGQQQELTPEEAVRSIAADLEKLKGQAPIREDKA